MKKIIMFFFTAFVALTGFGQKTSDTTVTTTMIYHLVKNGISVDSIVTTTYTKPSASSTTVFLKENTTTYPNRRKPFSETFGVKIVATALENTQNRRTHQ